MASSASASAPWAEAVASLASRLSDAGAQLSARASTSTSSAIGAASAAANAELRDLNAELALLHADLDGLEQRVTTTDQRATQDLLRGRWTALVREYSSKGGAVNARTILTLQGDVLARQDRALDDISRSVQRAGQAGKHINEEVTHQTTLLSDLERGVASGNETMRLANREAGEVVESGGTCKLWLTIVLLTIVVIFLLALL